MHFILLYVQDSHEQFLSHPLKWRYEVPMNFFQLISLQVCKAHFLRSGSKKGELYEIVLLWLSERSTVFLVSRKMLEPVFFHEAKGRAHYPTSSSLHECLGTWWPSGRNVCPLRAEERCTYWCLEWACELDLPLWQFLTQLCSTEDPTGVTASIPAGTTIKAWKSTGQMQTCQGI